MSATLPTSMTTTGPAVTQVSTVKTDAPMTTDFSMQKDSTIDSTHKEPRDALDAISGPSVGEQIKVAASKTATSIGSAATTAGQVISEKAAAAGHAISEKAHDVDTRFHIGDKMRDAASFAGAALKQGNPIHAAKHVGSAAAIGSAERAKHEAGPLPEGAHSATHQLADSTQNVGVSTIHTTPAQPTNMEIAKEKVSDAAAQVSAAASHAGTQISNSASAAASNMSASMSSAANTASVKASEMGANMQHSMATTSTNVGNKATDAASFAGTALKQGNPVFAASNAGTAAMIGQAERDKHAIGELHSEAAIRNSHQM